MGGIQKEVSPIDVYDIQITPEAQRGLLCISNPSRQWIIDGIDGLALNPRPSNSKRLVNAENLRRLRIGDYRVVYGISEADATVTIELVRHRGIVYTLLGALALTVRSKRYSK